MTEMRIADPAVRLITNEDNVLEELLHLQGASVLELGCGKADRTRIIARKAAKVLALEVDEEQLAKNVNIKDLPNVRFARGGAEDIPADDSSFDVVVMFKSLHHVPTERMAQVFSEIRRVLVPGGMAYISEPVYAGDFNELMKMFHDEKAVREAAFAAEQQAISSGLLKLVTQKFFLQPMLFESFDQFDERVLKVTHTQHRLSQETLERLRAKFDAHMTQEGATFLMPMRVDLMMRLLDID